jgi:hypothetical protein
MRSEEEYQGLWKDYREVSAERDAYIRQNTGTGIAICILSFPYLMVIGYVGAAGMAYLLGV